MWDPQSAAATLLPKVLVSSLQVVGTDSRGHVPINVPVTLETDSFVGYLRNSIKGYPGTPEWEFKGSKALGKAIIQVRSLLHPLAASCTGRPSSTQQLAHAVVQAAARELTAAAAALLQGRFKVPTPAKDVWMGQEFLAKPLLPARYVLLWTAGITWPKLAQTGPNWPQQQPALSACQTSPYDVML